MSRIGAQIKEIRTSKGMTPKQLARSLGVSESYVIEMENGKKVLSDDLLKKVCKALELDPVRFMLYGGEEIEPSDNFEKLLASEGMNKAVKPPVKAAAANTATTKEVQQVWSDAFLSVLKEVPIYDYSMGRVLRTRHMPVLSNKIEGYPKEKVAFIELQDNDMIGFRMAAGDIAFSYMTNEADNNTFCLLESGDKRFIRQIKKLDGNKLLLIHNNGKLATETVGVRDIKVLARLIKLEIKL